MGWKRLRAFIVDLDVDEARAFNVRKNRERGNIDAIKFGKILYEEKQNGANCKDLAKKYGYASFQRIYDYIDIYRNKDAILQKISPLGEKPETITFKGALRVLRELKREQRGEER